MKIIKRLILLLTLIAFIVTFYYKLFLYSIYLFILLFYFLYIFAKKIEYTPSSHFNRRAILTNNIILFVVILIVFRLIQVQVFNREYYNEKVQKQAEYKAISYGNRGSILDTNGYNLASNKNIYDLGINPSGIKDRPEMFDCIFEIYDTIGKKVDKNKVRNDIEKLYHKNRKYKVLLKKIDENEKEKIEKVIKKYKLTNNELKFDRNIERIYYKKDYFKNIIGMIGYTPREESKKVGIFGVEKQYENYLKEKKVEKKAIYPMNRAMKLPFSKDNSMNVDLDGRMIYTTIDRELQIILNEEVKKKFETSQSEEAYGIIMDPNNAKILATSYFTRDEKKALRNPIFQNQFEPGSTFKPIVMASALDKGLITLNSEFDVGDGKITKYRHTIRESSRSTKGVLTTKEVLKKSSNVGMVLIGDKFTNKEFEDSLREFGFYDKTGVDFPGELKPYTTPYKKWDGLKKSTMSFGQGIAVTPIQLVTAFSAVINGGTLYKPYIVEKITDNNGVVIRRNLTTPVRKVIDEKTSDIMKGILYEVVENGTGKKGRVEGYKVGGKTGTAQLSTRGGYLKENYLASYIGFFPLDNPKYVVLVMFLKPKGETIYEKFGGATAGPVFGDIVRRITKTKNILSQNVSKISKVKKLEDSGKNKNLGSEMPDLRGFSAKDIMYIFKDTDIDVKILGVGLVEKQEPEKGTSLENVKEIKVYLK